MKTQTKYFGEVSYTEEDLLHFPRGLFGFEEEQNFLLLPFSEEKTMFSLQSIKTPQLSFIVMDPFSLYAAYTPKLQAEELRELGVTQDEDLYFYVLCAVKNPVAESTVNMKCPVAINGDTRECLQVILQSDDYTMRHRLADFRPGEEEPPC